MTRAKLRVDKLEVRDARTHHVLLSLSGEALARDMNPVGGAEPSESVQADLLRRPMASFAAASAAATTIAGSQAVIVWLDVVVSSYAAVPAQLDHRIVASFVSPPPGAPESLGQVLTPVTTGPPSPGGAERARRRTVTGTPATAAAPTTRIIAAAWPASTGEMLVPQRFAIDWYRVDSRASGVDRRSEQAPQLPRLRPARARLGRGRGGRHQGRPAEQPRHPQATEDPANRGHGRQPRDPQGVAGSVPPVRPSGSRARCGSSSASMCGGARCSA